MKKTFVVFLILSATFVKSQVMWQFKKDSLITWHYKDGDEFNNNKVNSDYWRYSYGWARTIFGNKEQQYYTDGTNHFENNGTLKLTATQQSITARTVDGMNDNDSIKNNGRFISLNKKTFKYSAGMLQSVTTFVNGYFECRFKMPKQKGYWPAFWLYGGFPNEEIDILEGKSERPSQIHIDTHCANHCDYVKTFLKKQSYGGWAKTKANMVDEFNIVSCEWTKDYIKFFLNGEFIGISKVNFKTGKHIVVNMAVPSNDGPFHPGPNPKDTSTAVFEVDYVRVWDRTPALNKKKNPTQLNPRTEIETQTNFLNKKFLKNKKKVFYGEKAESKNEGFFVSMFQNAGQLQFTVLGKTEKQSVLIEVFDQNKTVIASKKAEQSIFNIDLSAFKQKSVSVKVSCGAQTATADIEIE